MWTAIADAIARATGRAIADPQPRSIGGGCISSAYRLDDGDRAFFVKLNRAERAAMFEAEALGLKDLRSPGAILVPEAVCWGVAEGSCYLVLSWLDLGGRGDWERMGRELATLHRWTGDGDAPQTQFGWRTDNTIGSTPQPNPWTDDWAEFFAEHRIAHQLRLARRNGGRFSLGDRLVKAIPDLLAGRAPQPSILHGDLWSGNASFTRDGTPVVLDPATYWGDREADLAMTELFGGFPPAFYRGYDAEFPLDDGYDRRKILYNLYHVLNHFNLFGGGYGAQAEGMMRRLVG